MKKLNSYILIFLLISGCKSTSSEENTKRVSTYIENYKKFTFNRGVKTIYDLLKQKELVKTDSNINSISIEAIKGDIDITESKSNKMFYTDTLTKTLSTYIYARKNKKDSLLFQLDITLNLGLLKSKYNPKWILESIEVYHKYIDIVPIKIDISYFNYYVDIFPINVHSGFGVHLKYSDYIFADTFRISTKSKSLVLFKDEIVFIYNSRKRNFEYLKKVLKEYGEIIIKNNFTKREDMEVMIGDPEQE